MPTNEQTQYLVVSGTSMWPTLRSGDVLALRAVRFEAGDIIAVQKSGFSLTHRVIQTKPCLLTKGDNLHFVDQVVCPDDVLGVAQFVLRRGRQRPIDLRDRSHNHARLFYAHQELYWLDTRLGSLLTTSARKRLLKRLTAPLYLLHCYWHARRLSAG